jgi:hypothetical protein
MIVVAGIGKIEIHARSLGNPSPDLVLMWPNEIAQPIEMLGNLVSFRDFGLEETDIITPRFSRPVRNFIALPMAFITFAEGKYDFFVQMWRVHNPK